MTDHEKNSPKPQPQQDQGRELNEEVYDSDSNSERGGGMKHYDIDKMQAPDPWPAPPEDQD